MVAVKSSGNNQAKRGTSSIKWNSQFWLKTIAQLEDNNALKSTYWNGGKGRNNQGSESLSTKSASSGPQSDSDETKIKNETVNENMPSSARRTANGADGFKVAQKTQATKVSASTKSTNTSNGADHGDEHGETDHNPEDAYEGSQQSEEVEQITISFEALMKMKPNELTDDNEQPEEQQQAENDEQIECVEVECTLTDLVLGQESETIQKILAKLRGESPSLDDNASTKPTPSDRQETEDQSVQQKTTRGEGGVDSDARILSAYIYTNGDGALADDIGLSAGTTLNDEPCQEDQDQEDEQSVSGKFNVNAPAFIPQPSATTKDPYDFSPEEYYVPHNNQIIESYEPPAVTYTSPSFTPSSNYYGTWSPSVSSIHSVDHYGIPTHSTLPSLPETSPIVDQRYSPVYQKSTISQTSNHTQSTPRGAVYYYQNIPTPSAPYYDQHQGEQIPYTWVDYKN